MPLSSAEERRSLKANVLGSIPRGAANVARGQGGYGPVCKTGETGSIPVRASKTLQWLERRGTDLLNRHMLVRIQSGAPPIFFHGRVAQWMSADLLHRRMHVRIVSRSPTWRVNWAGAQRRLLSDRPAVPVRIVLSTLRQIPRAWRTGVRAWLPTKTCEFDSHCPHQKPTFV